MFLKNEFLKIRKEKDFKIEFWSACSVSLLQYWGISLFNKKHYKPLNILFLSSVFKKNKNYLGLNKFKLLKNLTNKKVMALGGITSENLKKLSLINCKGFAGISYFQKKTAPQGGRLNYLISI